MRYFELPNFDVTNSTLGVSGLGWINAQKSIDEAHDLRCSYLEHVTRHGEKVLRGDESDQVKFVFRTCGSHIAKWNMQEYSPDIVVVKADQPHIHPGCDPHALAFEFRFRNGDVKHFCLNFGNLCEHDSGCHVTNFGLGKVSNPVLIE